MTALDAVPSRPIEASRLPGLRPASKGASRELGIVFRWAVPLALAGATAFGVVRYKQAHATTPVRYETASVDRGAVVAKVTATGALSALVTVSVGSQVSGRIDSLHADFGSSVKKGQVIAAIEPSFFRAAVAQARANYASATAEVAKAQAQLVGAQRQFERAKRLGAEGLISQTDYDTAEANFGIANAGLGGARSGVAQANAALAQANLNLVYTTIVSPIDGVVISRNVDIGQTVAATLQAPTLFTIAQDLTRMQVDTNLAEADVGKIRAGTNVTFTVDAYTDEIFPGVVRQVRDNAQTVQNVVTYDAVIDVDNTARLLKPSMTASVTFVYATRDNALRIPNAALRFKPDAPTIAAMLGPRPAGGAAGRAVPRPNARNVWAIRGGRAVPASVQIGITDGSVTELLGGDIREGDNVVVEANADIGALKRAP